MARLFAKKGPIGHPADASLQLRRRSFTRVRQLTQAIFIGSGLVSAFGVHYFASAANLANSTASTVVTTTPHVPLRSVPARSKGTSSHATGHSTTTLPGHSTTRPPSSGRPVDHSSTTLAPHSTSPTSTVPRSAGAVTTTIRPLSTPTTVPVTPTTPTTLATPTTVYVPPTTVPITTTTICTTTPSGKVKCT